MTWQAHQPLEVEASPFYALKRFHLLILLFLASTTFSVYASDAPAEPKAPNRSFAHFGVSFLPPMGWHEEMREGYNVIGWWSSSAEPAGTDDPPRSTLRVEAGNAPKVTLEDAARGLAQQWDAKVSGKTTLGGDPALRVVGIPPGKGEGKRPVEGIVCKHGKFVYLLMGGVTPGGEVHETVEAVRESWKWIGVEIPSKQLGFGRQPYRIFGRVLIDLPALMCLDEIDDPSRQAHFAMPNPTRGGPEWLCFAQVVPQDPNVTFEQFRARLIYGITEKMKPDPQPAWEALKAGSNSRFITNRLECDVPAKKGEKPERGIVQWAMVEMDAKTIVLINFTYNDKDPESQARYEAAARKIVASIRLAPPQKKPAAGGVKPPSK